MISEKIDIIYDKNNKNILFYKRIQNYFLKNQIKKHLSS